MTDLQTIFALATPAVVVVIWLIRLEGRVNTNQAVNAANYGELKDDIRYIRDRIDRALNGHS